MAKPFMSMSFLDRLQSWQLYFGDDLFNHYCMFIRQDRLASSHAKHSGYLANLKAGLYKIRRRFPQDTYKHLRVHLLNEMRIAQCRALKSDNKSYLHMFTPPQQQLCWRIMSGIIKNVGLPQYVEGHRQAHMTNWLRENMEEVFDPFRIPYGKSFSQVFYAKTKQLQIFVRTAKEQVEALYETPLDDSIVKQLSAIYELTCEILLPRD